MCYTNYNNNGKYLLLKHGSQNRFHSQNKKRNYIRILTRLQLTKSYYDNRLWYNRINSILFFLFAQWLFFTSVSFIELMRVCLGFAIENRQSVFFPLLSWQFKNLATVIQPSILLILIHRLMRNECQIERANNIEDLVKSRPFDYS